MGSIGFITAVITIGFLAVALLWWAIIWMERGDGE